MSRPISQENQSRQYITQDWLVKILIGIVAFFLVSIFLTVQKTAADVGDLKTKIPVIQNKVQDLGNRVQLLEHRP